MIGLFAAVIQHRRLLVRLDRPGYACEPPLPRMFMAILLLLVGAFGFVAMLL